LYNFNMSAPQPPAARQPSIPIIVRLREQQREKDRRRSIRKFGLIFSSLFSLLTIFLAIGIGVYYTQATSDLPSLDILPQLFDPPDGLLLKPTQFFDRNDGHLLYALENPAASGHRYLPYDESQPDHLPGALILATIAIADPTFWQNPGVNWNDVINPIHPTVAQRIVSDLVLREETPGLRRSVREALLATQITSQFGKKKVLEWYLNSVKMGPLVYGADAAARFYFNKSATKINLAEAALLAAIAEDPDINPFTASQMVIDRQKQVLQAMLAQKLISSEAASQALLTTLQFYSAPNVENNLAAPFYKLLTQQLEKQISPGILERGGFHIRTTLDYNLQLQSECTVLTQMKRMAGQSSEVLTESGSPCEASHLLPSLTSELKISLSSLATDVVILDPRSGQLLAMVAVPGAGSDFSPLSDQTLGSLFSPFIYLTAFSRGMSPASLVWDIPTSLPDAVQNQPGVKAEQFHGPVRLRTAFANDYLTPAIQILAQVGPENVWRIAQQSGLNSLEINAVNDMIRSYPFLSGAQASLLEVSQAFGVFTNQGVQTGLMQAGTAKAGNPPPIQPITILKVEDNNHQVWMNCAEPLLNCTVQSRPVVSSQLAYLTTQVLSDESSRWPSLGHPNPLEIGQPAGAKIGRVGDYRSAWTVGFTPQLVVGVWMADQGTDALDQNSLADNTADLWHALIQYASRGLSQENWNPPEGITAMEVCDPSGMLPTANCPTVVNEIFINGNEPTQFDTLYRVIDVNREIGRAHV
jgi:membrane peptidoglycan carboxypeptidase